jgi:hypothetical protein
MKNKAHYNTFQFLLLSIFWPQIGGSCYRSYKSLLLCLWLCTAAKHSQAQSIYYSTRTGTSSSIWQVDIGACSYNELYSGISPAIHDFVETPGGFYYTHRPNSATSQMYLYNPVTGTSTLLTTLNVSNIETRLLLISPTEILWVLSGTFYKFDMTTNTASLLASFPNGRSWSLFTYNGQIYYFEGVEPGPTQTNVYTITLTPVFQRNFVINLPLSQLPEGLIPYDFATSCDIPIGIDGNNGHQVYTYNMQNYTYGTYCSWAGNGPPGLYATAPLLNDPGGPRCGCSADAGTWNWSNLSLGGIIYICADGSVTLPHNGNQVLAPGQSLSFALVSSGPSQHFYDNLQTNLAYIYDSPVISFIPGIIQPNTVYYVYPVVSNAPPGAIDLSDICRDIQFRLTVMWRTPSVTFTQNTTQPCASGCRTLNVGFQGTPPFQLSYQVTFGNSNPQVFSQTFSSTFGTLQICPPAGFDGQIQVNAQSLTDGTNCSCN